MKRIPLTKGYFTLVDDEDFERLSKYKWHYSNGYASRTWHSKQVKGIRETKEIGMHRQILNTPLGMHTDHINGNTLNNQKYNIRICKPVDNYHNSKIHRNNTSGYKGIAYTKSGKRIKRWQAQIRIGNNKRLHLGRFNSKEEAALAYNRAAKKYHGEFARLNEVAVY